MSMQPDIPESLDPLGTWRAARDASQEIWQMTRDISLETWSKLMIDMVNSEEYSQATSQWLDAYLTLSQPFQRVLETTMTQALSGLNMPTRADVTNLAERMTNVEMRLDDLDAKLDVILHALQSFAASNPAPKTTTMAPIPPVKSASASREKSSGRTQGKPKEVP
jgi:hypothetical protein